MRWKTFMTVALVAVVAFGEDAVDKSVKRGRRSHAYTGGFVMRPAQGKSICFANAQSMVAENVLQSAAQEISRAVGINITVSRLDDANADPASLRDKQTAAVVVVRAVKEASGPTMVVAPENAWAVLDVGALAKDGAASEVLVERVRKELWRTTAIMLGASDSTFRPCLLEPVHSLAELDALKAKTICPEPYGSIQRNAKALGCGSPVYATYRAACREGWASAPTNAVQKAIWEEVRADKERGPTNPITIPPPNHKK